MGAVRVFEVIEAVSYAKTGDEALNEDAYVVGDGLLAVFDGETNKGPTAVPTPGRRAAQSLVCSVRDLPRTDDPTTIVKHLQVAVAEASGNGEAVAAVGAVLDVHWRRLIRVGDVAVGINGEFQLKRKLIDEIAAASRAALLRSRLLDGCDIDELRADDPGREMILPLLRASTVWRNRVDSAYGFASLDGGVTPTEMIDVFDIDDGMEIIIATDGYKDPRPTLSESEETLTRLIAEDPLQLGPPPGTKGVLPGHRSFDDRTYVRVRF